MKIQLLLLLIFILSSCQEKDDWQNLFNGKDLSNFEILNGEASYEIEGNTIVGISKENTRNTFLATKEKYSNFILEFEVFADTILNSGVQFRSIADPNIMDGTVHGYQCEIESSPRKWAGGIYDESRRGWIYPLKENPTGQFAFKRNAWNKYRIEAIDDEIRTWVNGIQCANLKDNMTKEGIIGLQVHSIDKVEQIGKKIKWRKLLIVTENLEQYRWKSEEYAKLIDLTKEDSK
ncbi:MAG: DUF1080 domain-containing protein [Bacteroidota bacterium]